MFRPVQLVRAFGRDESGATAIEYALLAGLVGVALVVSLTALSDSLWGTLNEIAETVQNAWAD